MRRRRYGRAYVLVLAAVLVVAMVCGIREVWAISRDLAVTVGIMAVLYLLMLVDAWRCAVPWHGRKYAKGGVIEAEPFCDPAGERIVMPVRNDRARDGYRAGPVIFDERHAPPGKTGRDAP